jgi:plasmid stabilization system protein ParE
VTRTKIELVPDIAKDFERILEQLDRHDVADPGARIAAIIDVLDVLEHNPRIGRPAAGEMRELVIGRREQGCLARYRYIEEIDTVFALAIRSQREAGYREEG